MIASIKAEFRKLFTVRATYYILLFTLVLVIFFAFYINGWRIDHHHDLLNPFTLMGDASGAIATISIFASLIGVLLVTHEYRFNTIMHTLTLSNSRSRVFISKFIVVSIVAIVFAAFFGALSPLLSEFGAKAHHLTLVPQTIYYKTLAWHILFYCWGYAMAGLVLAFLIRNQVGAIDNSIIHRS
jgi:ABC-2 type transport system permease protein